MIYTFKVLSDQDPELSVWLKVKGERVELRSMVAVRNYLRNHRYSYTFVALYKDGIKTDYDVTR